MKVEKLQVKASKFIYIRANMRIGKIASSAKYRMDEQFQNCQFLEPNFDSPN